MRSMLAMIANYLTTETISKKHGGYNIYLEQGKIRISYDTYNSSVCVYVWAEGKKEIAAHYNGGGVVQTYHGGAWESYVKDVLYPKAVEAKKVADEKREQRKLAEAAKNSARLNDEATFNN